MLSKGKRNIPHFVVSGCNPHLPSSMTSFETVSEADLWEVNCCIRYVDLDSCVCVGFTSVQFSLQLPPEIKMSLTNNRESGGPESSADCLVPKLVCTSHRLISSMCRSLSCWKYPSCLLQLLVGWRRVIAYILTEFKVYWGGGGNKGSFIWYTLTFTMFNGIRILISQCLFTLFT